MRTSRSTIEMSPIDSSGPGLEPPSFEAGMSSTPLDHPVLVRFRQPSGDACGSRGRHGAGNGSGADECRAL
jgi:hypothetical protein